MTLQDRLKEERERLGFNQTQFGAIGGTTKKSQIDYEKGTTQPRASYLAALAKIGVDVQYVLTGERSAQALSNDEILLLDAYRAAKPDVKRFMLQGIQPHYIQDVPRISVENHGKVGQQIHAGDHAVIYGGNDKKNRNKKDEE